MIYYRLLAYRPDDIHPNQYDDCPDVIDFTTKENAITVARLMMDMVLTKTEKFSSIDVYEMHPDENRSESVLSISF